MDRKLFAPIVLALLFTLCANIFYLYLTDQTLVNQPKTLNQKPQHLFSLKSRELKQPIGLAVDKKGRVYVGDGERHGVAVFNSGGLIDFFGVYGNQRGQMDYPYGLAVLRNGNLLIGDSGNYRLQEFTPRGRLVKVWLDQKKGVKPGAVISKEDCIFVTDLKKGAVLVFNQQGQEIKSLSGQIQKLNSPQGLAIIDKGLWVAESGNNQLHFFSFAGKSGQVIIGGTLPSRDKFEPFAMVKGIAVDSLKRIIVADTTANQIRFFDNAGKELFRLGSIKLKPALHFPSNLFIDRKGIIYIINRGSHEVQAWGYPK